MKQPEQRTASAFVLAHLSDPHLAGLDTIRWQQLLNKRLTGYLSWQRRRRHLHLPEQLALLVQDLHSQAPDHIAVTGDLTQIDLPNTRRCGLLEASEVLRGIDGISFVYFDEKDVVRHSLVQRIVKAYEKYQEQSQERQLTLKLSVPPEPADTQAGE